jgi:hypothetical protein
MKEEKSTKTGEGATVYTSFILTCPWDNYIIISHFISTPLAIRIILHLAYIPPVRKKKKLKIS